jgi:hypothetical protein
MASKPTSTVDLALTLIDLAKAGAALLFILLLDFARQKEAKAKQLLDKERLDRAIENSKPRIDPAVDPRDVVEQHLKGSGKTT